jgi:hypothetical protein
MNLRYALDAGLVVSILFAPVWVTVLLLGALAVWWRAWEVIPAGFIIDALYMPEGGLFGIPFVATLACTIAVWGLEPIRAYLLRRS